MIDPFLVLKQFLESKNLVGNRIYATRLPEGFNNTHSALVLFTRSGSCDLRAPLYSPSFQIKCYGGSPNMQASKTLYRSLHDVLHGAIHQNVTEGCLMSAHEEVLGQELIDPDTDWPYVLTFYNCNIRPK